MPSWLDRLLRHRSAPLVLLIAVCAVSFGARVFHIDIPNETHAGNGLIFDERYYVNAARVMAGAPMAQGETYANAAPPGDDPNAEHPQLGKMIIALGIRVFGDNPVAWRFSAVIAGTAALLLLYWLVRVAGGSGWLALGAAALAAVDNLWMVSGRIAVLDVYCLPFMLAGAAFYLRRQPIVAGILIGVGACIKEFALYALLALLLLELFRWIRAVLPSAGGWSLQLRRAARPALLTLMTVATFVSLLAVLDWLSTPYHDGHRVDEHQSALCDHALVWSGACNHISFMNGYAAALRSPHGPQGIASYPWQFWGNVEPIDYYTVTTTVRSGSTVQSVEHVVAFRATINPVLLVTAWLAILLGLWWAVRRRDEMSLLVVAWILATWLPAELFSLVDQRTTYLYYMVFTMPALYIAVARMLGMRVVPRWLVGVWVGLLLSAAAFLYPFRTFTGT